jgi:hypothetical protein
MSIAPGLIPTFRGSTIVGTALSKECAGDLTHLIVCDTTHPEEVVVVFALLP